MKTLLVALVALVLAAPALAVNANDPTNAWVTDGNVYAVAATPNEVLVGGDFTLIGRETGSWVSIAADGTVPQTPPAQYDGVLDAVSDGARGWFLLTSNDQDDTRSVVHLLADRTLDPKWKIEPDGYVNAIARHGRTLYLGGDFTKVNGARRWAVAAIDMRTRKLLPFDAGLFMKNKKETPDVQTLAVSPDGATLYLAGTFEKPRNGLAAVATATGKPTGWRPTIDGDVYTLVAAGNVVY